MGKYSIAKHLGVGCALDSSAVTVGTRLLQSMRCSAYTSVQELPVPVLAHLSSNNYWVELMPATQEKERGPG